MSGIATATHGRRTRVVALVVATLVLAAIAAGLVVLAPWSAGDGDADAPASSRGTPDRFAGTWVRVGDPDAGLSIERIDASSYRVADPDQSNAFVARVSANGTQISGTLILDRGDGAGATVQVTIIAAPGGRLVIAASGDGRRVEYTLRRLPTD